MGVPDWVQVKKIYFNREQTLHQDWITYKYNKMPIGQPNSPRPMDKVNSASKASC